MDFEKARFNMVEQQIRPWDVLDFRLLDVLQELPRERFVSEEQKPYAYADMTLSLPNRSVMLEPKIVARLVQALDIKESDTVLEVGTGGGYATAVLAKLAKKVVTFDIDGEQSARAAAVLGALHIDNVDFRVGDGFDEALNGDASYDAVYVGGAVAQVPDELRRHLRVGGRLAVVVGGAPVQEAVLIVRNDEENFTPKTLFETFIPSLIQGSRSLGREAFVF